MEQIMQTRKVYHVTALWPNTNVLQVGVLDARNILEAASVLLEKGFGDFEICATEEEKADMRSVIFKEKDGKPQIHFFTGGSFENMDTAFCDANREQASFLALSERNGREVLGIVYPNRLVYGEAMS
jgi:hypothetical protein